MEETGQKSLLEPFTFKYPGREPKYVTKFLSQRPEIKSFYIYDLELTTGKLLYQCAGGIGITKEKYMVDMHNFISRSSSVELIRRAFKTIFGKEVIYRKYMRAQERVNNKPNKTKTTYDCAELYCLWAASGFSHRYFLGAHRSFFQPARINYDGIDLASRIARKNKIIFKKENFLTFNEKIITDNVILYFHLPEINREYGPEYKWNKSELEYRIHLCKEFNELGYKVCVSAQYEKRGLILKDYPSLLKDFNYNIITPFKSNESGILKKNSEIYLTNF